MPDNVDKLFEIMQANGAANDRNKFRKVFLTPGNKGYKIRKDIYDGLRADGIIDSPTYEDFRRKLRLGGTPTVNKYRQQMFNSADPTKNKASELTRKAVKTAHKAMDNVRKPVRGAVVNKQGKKVKEFDITPAKTLDDLNREYAQEVASDWEKEQQRQSLYNTTRSLDEVQRKIAERDAQLDEADNGFWTGIRHAAQGMNVTGGMFQQYDDDMRKELIDPKYKQYLVEANYLTQMKKQLIQEEEDAAAPNATKWDRFKHASSSFTSGMLDEAFGSDAFDFGGYIKMRESDVLLRINDRINRGVATDDDRRLLQILKDKEEVESRLDNDAYSFGRGASQSAGFVTDFLITGGGDFGGLGRLGGKMALGLARKTFAKTMTKDLGKRFAAWSLKNLGKTLGEATGAAMTATSVQVGKTAANATQRYLGLDSDDGGLEYDKDGNLKFKGGTDVGTAIAKAIASGTIENYTELLGPHITSMGKRLFGWAGVGLEKITPDALSKFFDKVGSSELFKRIGTFTDEIANSKVLNAGKKALAKVGVNDMPEEGLEEEAGIILNSLITGDNKFSDLWDKETQYKTWGGVMSMMGAMRAIPIAYSAVGTAYSASKNKVEYFKCKHDLTKAETLARQALGNKWTPIKELIDNADNKHIIEVGINIIRQSDKYSQEQAKAAQNYIGQLLKMRGFNNATMASIRDKNAKGEGQTDADKKDIEVSNAYAEGHEAEGELRHQIQLEYEKRTANLAKRLGLTPEKIDAINVDSFSSYIGLNSDADFDIFQYKKAKAAYDGVMDNAQNLVDIAGEVAAQRVDNMTNVHDGTIRKAYKKGTEMNPDSPVYIISGNIKLNDDGSINYTDSDKMLVVYDEETGQREAMGNFMLASVDPNIQNAEEVKAQAIQAAKQKIITEQSNVIDGILAEGSEFTMESNDGSSHNYKIVQVDEQGNCIVSVDGTVLPEPLSLDAIQQQYDQSNVARSVKNDQTTQESEQTTQEPEQIQQESQSIEDKFDYDKITNENDGKVKRVDVTDEEGKNRFPNAKAVFLIQDKGAMPKFVVMDEEGNLTSYVGKRGDKIHLKGEMTIDEYKKQRQEELQMIAAENADSSMIEDNSGTIEVEDNTQPLSETDADNVIAQMESSAETAPDLELTPDNWTAEFGEDGILSTPIGDVKMGENQVAKLFEKGRSKEFGMIKPTLTNPDVIIEVPSRSTDGNEERSSSYLFIKTFLGKNGKKVYYFKSVTIKKDGLEISISSHYDRVKRVKEALMKGKLLYRKNDGAQTEQNQPSASVTTSQEDAAGSSESKDTNISSNGNENNESLTFEDGTPIPVDMNGEVDLSQTDASHAAEWYDNNLGEDADDWLDGEIKKAKKVLEQAKNKKLAGTKPSELVASKKEKEAAIADAQAHYDSAISIRDSLKERRIEKVEDTAEGRKELIEKARRKFARLKSAVKDDAEAVLQLYRETIGSLLHRLYDSTGIDVTDTTPLTAEEYVASNLGAHSLNYEGTETSKGVKQETGLSREDFAKTQLLAADGKGTTIDALVHSLWENRPSNLESLDTQDIRNALIGLLNSGFKASEARNFVENIRIAQAENILEEQKRAQENAAYAEQHKAEPEAELKAKSDEKAELKAKSEAKLDNESDNESNDLDNETDNEQINDNINDNINAPEQNKFPDKLKEGSKTIEVPEDATDEKPLGEQRTDSPFSARKNGKQQTEAERAADVEKNKVDDVGLVDAVIGEKIRKSFERIAKMMGAKIQYQRTDKLGNGWIQETTDADGNVHRTIFITLDSSITKGAQFIFGHEMTHQIKHLNPAAYNELTQLVLDTYGSDAFDKAVDETMQRYSDAGFSGRARDYYAEEVVADSAGEMIRDLNLAHTLAMKMSHPLLAAIHEILQKIKLAFFGTEYSDVTKNIIRSIEQAYVKTANGQVTNSETGEDVSFSLRQKPEPKKKGVGYKVFVLKDGKLYPPMVANPDGAATPVGVWLDADAAPIAGESKTGRPQVKQGGKGTQGGSGKLAYRPGWHLGVVPYAIQFNRKDADGNKTLFPKNFVFAEVEYAADVDYQEEARQEGINPSGKYQHSLAGLKHLPTDGYYMYRTNPNPETDPWVITGAMKVNRILTRAEQAELVKNAGREPQQIQEGDIVTDDVVNSINQEIADAPKFSLKVYHGNGADFTEFDFDHMGEGAGSQVFGWGGYVTSSEKIGKSYAGLTIKNRFPSEYDTSQKQYTLSHVLTFTLEGSDKNEAIQKVKGLYNESLDKIEHEHPENNYAISNLKERIETLDEMEKGKLPIPTMSLYEVDIPDDNGSNYLEWEKKPSDEVATKIIEGLYGLDAKTLDDMASKDIVFRTLLYDYIKNADKEQMIPVLVKTHALTRGTTYDNGNVEDDIRFVYNRLSRWMGSQKAASQFLSSIGFTGIKYPAGTIMGGAEENDTNYVIFKPEDMRITEHTKFSIRLKSAIEETETNPSDAQKESGNYKKGHIKFGGYDYTIENPKGSTRSGKDADGKEWKVTMHDTYGYIRGKFGKDGDHLDMFINDKADLDNWNGDVFVVDQVNPDGSFDEHKVMYGYDFMDDAKKAYLANYSKGWQGLGNITGASKDEFDKWLDTSKRKLKPFADYAKVKFALKSIPVRFKAGKKLSDEEKKEVLSTLKDAYKVNGVPYHIEETAGGKEKRVYEPTADSYVVSDITNRPLRYYITLPDGRVAHPTEVYPNISDNEVKSSATKQGLLDEEADQIVSAAIGNMKDIADNAKAIEVLTELQNLPHETHDVGYGMNNAQSYNYKTGIFTSDAAQAIDYVVRRMRRKEDVPTEIPAALKKAVADSYGMVDNLIGGMSTTKFSLKKVNDDFNQRLEELVKNPNQKDKILRLGRSSSFLKVGGITDAEIELDFDKFIRKSGDKYKNNHPFAASDLINLPMALAEPIAVFNSTTANDHVVLTELQKDGKNFIVAVRAVEQHRKGGVVLEVNKITSLYPKEERGIVYWINNGRISNVDKEKALHFIEALQPHAGTTITDEELKSAANIINSFETTKKNGEKVDVETPKTFDEFLNHPSLKFSIKNEQQRKAAEDAYEYASKLRPNKSSQYALVNMSNPSSSPEYYEKKVLADRWRRFYNKAVHNELDDVYKDAWGNYKLFDLDRPFADQVNEVKGDVPNEFNAPDVVANKNADNESGAEYHEYKQDEPSSITYKDRYKAFKQREANREKTAGLRKERKETEDSYNSKSKERVEYNKQLMKEYMDEHGLSSENDIPDDVWEDLRSKSFEKYQDELDSLFNRYKDLDKQIKAVAEPRFSLKDEKTMFGMHNISLDKLRKAIKQGGFAAPSMGVIDSKNGIYSGYGEITLIPKAEKIAKRTGKNIGTYAADAWTPIYPPVEKKFGGNGGDVAYEDIESVPKEMQRLTRNAINSFMDGREANGLAYLYLQEKGKAPELVHVEGKYPKELHDEVKGILGKLNGIYNTTDEQKEKLLDLFIREVYDGNKEEFDNDIKKFIKKDEEFIKKRPNSNIAKNKQLDVDWMKEHGYDYGALSRFVDGILRDAETSGKVDENATMKAAQQYIQDKGMKEDFDSWKEKLNDRYNVEEVIFAGYKPDGNRKYLPNTVENAVKVMKQDGKNASVGSASFSHFVASILKPMGTLDQIRKKKGNLTGNYEDVEKFQEKWQPVYDELADKMQPDAELFESYGMDRLEEVTTQKNPKKYAKEEYGVDLTDEDINKLNELIEAVKNDKPSIYFETKFMRPYGLDEFEKAIVPNDTPSDVVDALKMAGIDVSSYERGNAEDRQKVTMDAINSSDNIRFSLAGERGAADMAEDLKSLNTPDEVDDAIKTAIDDMPSGWQMANKKMIHIAQALGENRKAEIAGEEPKFSLKDGSLIKAGTYFSGGGLVEEGLKGIIDPVLAVEYDEKISGVYRNNFGQHIVTADVRDVDPKELVKQIDGEVEYFHASPVCKNYSQAKSNHAEVELDKETAASTAEFINAIKPKVVTIENVKGYKDSDAMKTITDALDANGYTWDADVYNAADYGGYTNRERLIVRAIRDGKLPAKPEKMAHKSGWYEAVADIIPTLTEKKNGVAPWMDVRLKADGIDWRNIDKPLYVMGSAYADGKIPHAFADELLPTLRTKSGDVIVMPDGKVYRAMGRVLARVSGVSDDYKMPFSENLSHTIIGNGIPTQLTEHVIAPLLQNTLRPTTPEDGNTKFSLRGSTPYGKQMEEWMEKNHLEKGAVPMEKPIMKEGENIFDYANRMVEWTRNQNLWKTAPKQTGFQDALDKWKADNGLSPNAYPPVHPHRENYSTEIGYAEDLEEYNKKKELWKSAPKPKDFDLSVDLEDMNKQLRNIRRAVLNQKNYDQRTVKAVSDLVRKMLNIGWGDGLSRGKVGNLLSAAKNATGANDVKKYLDKAMGILAENYLNRLSTAYDNLINTKGARADQSGVIKMGSLDAKGQAFMSEYKKAINMDDSSLNTYIANIEEDSAKNEDNVEMNDYRLAGIQAAIMYKQQIGGNDADIAELKRQIGELKNKKDATKEDKDLLKSLEKKLFENKFDRITMYENLLNNIQRMVKESKGRAKEFREEIAEHKNEILHRANLDLEGVDSTYYDTTTAKKKFVNNDLQRAVFSSTYTFEQFLKFFGKKAANGEGYLYNYFTKLNQDALDEEQLYNEMNRNALDEKTKELFGKEKFMKLVGIDGKGMKEMDVEVTDYSNKETGKRTIHLKQGQMLYIYLVNKETDGEMKLRAMGITEEDVAAIEENLDPRVKAMGEWLQDEYLPECQRRYQATHTKYFGAPMKEVENYFPLAINNRARNVKEDVNQDSDAMSQLAGTSTGAIVTRRVNVIPLDIENADAFEVAFNHLQEMEEWSAMLPFRQDINTLLSYTHFRNQVQNMSSVAYGSGKTLWDEFKQTAQIAAGTYKPKVNAGMMDSRIAAAMGGIAVAKISGRLWTAIKQSQSATVFLPECDFTRFVKNGVNPYGSWKWAMENIPDFRKRVENMTYGDVKLRQYLDELEKWHDWTKTISKIGMASNILVDGITCAVGARSVYETEVNRLTKLGYPKEKAEEKAYYKAVAAYNKTQQSSGGMYLSPMQVDRTYASAALSLFKNANFAYGRMQIEACRGLARTYDFWGGKHKTTLIESMTRQIMEEDGLDENTARAIAKATYNRTFRQSIGRLINFATLVPVSWALYKVLPYLLTGDDDDKKKDMIEEAVLKGFATSLSDNYVIPFASNILNAGLKVEDGKPTFDTEVFKWQNLYINPATSDLANIYSMIGNQKWYSVANKLGMLGVQSLIGFNPETVGALYQAFAEADYDNGNTAKEWQIGILKAISAPEETIRELYMDELGLKSGDIKKIPLAELEKRYAERQINRDNLLSQIGMDAETFNGYVDKYQKSFEKKIKDKMDKWDEYDKKKADEFFDTTSDTKLKDMIEKKRTKDANAAADEQIAKEGLNQEKKGKEPSEEAYDAVKMSIDVAEDNAISTYNKVLNKRYASLNDEYNEQTDAMKYIFMSKHPYFKAYKDLESEYTTYGKKMKELKEKLVSADGYDAKQTILKQIRAEREKFSELQSKVR